MFTGIIEEMGEVQSLRESPHGVCIALRAKKILSGLKRGGSIAVNGVCLTAVKISSTGFCADLSHETVRVTNLGSLTQGEKVNLERPLRVQDRLEGHIVLGHVEGVGIIQNRKVERNSITLTFSVPSSLMKYCIPKGSLTVDGVSLTIVACNRRFVTVVIIPHTATVTTLGIKEKGAFVNLETDPIGKYVERLMTRACGNGHSGATAPAGRRRSTDVCGVTKHNVFGGFAPPRGEDGEHHMAKL